MRSVRCTAGPSPYQEPATSVDVALKPSAWAFTVVPAGTAIRANPRSSVVALAEPAVTLAPPDGPWIRVLGHGCGDLHAAIRC